MRSRIGVPLVMAAGAAVLMAAPALAAVGTSPASSSDVVGPVLSSVEAGGRLYIGGTFTRVDTTSHAGLAAVDASTGVRDPGFRADVTGAVRALATDGTNIFIGGSFSSVGGVSRTNLAALTPSGQLIGTFQPKASSTVESLDYVNGTLYVGGAFTTINGVNRKYLAALDPINGTVSSTFNPQPNGIVHVVKSSGSQIYAGGKFTTIGGAARNYVARLDAAGVVQPYDARLGLDAQVFDIAPTDSDVYLGAGGHLPVGNSAYATDVVTGAQRWQVKVDGDVESIEPQGGDVYVGGHFNNTCSASSTTTCLIDFASRKAVVVDAGTGAPRPFASFNSAAGIRSFTTAGGNLYALGEFTKVNGMPRAGIARFPIQ
ncbi:hypothetical protein ACOCJ7_05780 [Knoellia sp. CPCC 206453]|uniref:hypothetical protein n=1 Tax=Knoellia pratensis TaxID=3404796 RepID=UPI0036087F90